MHGIFAATSGVIHERYFHDSRAAVPAQAMEDVFAEMAQQSYELIENKYYRRAGAIPLASGCMNCHAGFFHTASQEPSLCRPCDQRARE